MKSLAFLKQVAHDSKTAMYAAERVGKTRSFAYREELEALHETLAQLIQREQGVRTVRTPLGGEC